MVINKVTTIDVEFSDEEKDILSKASEILRKLDYESDEVAEIPMKSETYDLVNAIGSYSISLLEKLCFEP